MRTVPPASRSPETDVRWSAARDAMNALESSAGRLSTQRFAGVGGIILAIVLFLATGVLQLVSLNQLEGRLRLVDQTNTISFAVDSLQVALGDATLTARSIALGALASGLPALQQKRDTVISRTKQLEALTAGDPAARSQVRVLSGIVARRLALIAHMAALAHDNHFATREATDERTLITLAREFNASLASLRQITREILLRRQAVAEDIASSAMWLALAAAIAAPAFGILGIFLTLRERASIRAREIQSELMHAQRLAMMGETSSMLAHEINQPLTAATNYVSALRRFLSAPAPVPAEKVLELTDRAAQQLQRTANVLKRLRNFIQKRDNERGIELASALVDDAVMLLATIEPSVNLQTHAESDLPPIVIDRVQVQQVLVNLMRNACEAMRDCPRRELQLSVDLADGTHVRFSLADTGPGLPDEVAGQLFKPFVSTKQDGMGVGLSISAGIVAAHGGRIWAEPNPGGGTIFRFTLLVMSEVAAA